MLDVLFPLSCPACGRFGPAVCPECIRAFVPAPRASPPPGVDELVAAFSYEGPARELIARIKYRGAHAAVAVLADAMVARLGPVAPARVVSWIPTTAAHRRTRGFDHAALLADAVAHRLDLPLRPLLARNHGPAQTGRSRRERLVGPRLRALVHPPDRVLLVDDVATTGATMTAGARVLRHARGSSGATLRVVGLVAGRTPSR